MTMIKHPVHRQRSNKNGCFPVLSHAYFAIYYQRKCMNKNKNTKKNTNKYKETKLALNEKKKPSACDVAKGG